MNKQQEKIAEKVIAQLKKSNGKIKAHDLELLIPGITVENKYAIFGGLSDRKLIQNSHNVSKRLTEKGWDFKSFAYLRRKKIERKIKKNVSFILNIIFLVVTIILSMQNSTLQETNLSLSEKNAEIIEKVTKLEGKLNRLDVQLNYLLKYQNEISLLDSIK